MSDRADRRAFGADLHSLPVPEGWTLSGTTVDGERLEIRGCDLWTFRDGRIVRVRSFYDTAKYVEAMHGAEP